MTNEPDLHSFTVEDLQARYMRRFHEGPVRTHPLPAMVSCDACNALIYYDPEGHGMVMVDFPPQVRL